MRDAPVRIGPYEIVMELAAGGMATTFVACKRGETFFERLVVLKRIHPWLLQDPKSSDMLRDEARLAGAIQHPHVVHVEDVINHDGEVCLVMPYVESLSLAALLKAVRQAGERIPPAIASRILIDVLAGLHAAHEAKDIRGEPLHIVHRDLSPNNILVGTEGQSRIIDFGIARATSRLCQTNSRDMKGTIAYMSPEQLRRRDLDRRADVFAAGAVLYELLTGQRLFDGQDEADILIGVLADEVPAVSSQCPEVCPDVDGVVARALARDRDERFPSAHAFADAIGTTLAPASPADVGVWVNRFGTDEFVRRRATIRTAIDREVSEAAPLGTHTETSPAIVRTTQSKRTVNNWKVLAGSLGVVAVLSIAARTAADRRGDSHRALVHGVPTFSVGKSVGDVVNTAQTISALSSGESPASTHSNSAPLPAKSSTAKSPPVPSRPALPSHEKVDTGRGSELQENPYR